MARPQFKQWWLQFVPKSVERSTYVCSPASRLSCCSGNGAPCRSGLAGRQSGAANAVIALSFAGWLIVLASTFMINHFELFGLHQVFQQSLRQIHAETHFKTPMLYNFVRHPIYLGFIIAFWAAPTMTVGHLLFAAVTTAYIFVGIFLEEHDLSRCSAMITGATSRASRCWSRGANRPDEPAPIVRRRRFAGAACILLTCRDGNPRRSFRAVTARSEGRRYGGARTHGALRQSRRDLPGGAPAARQHRHLDREPAAGRRGVPASTEDVQEIVRICAAHRVPVIRSAPAPRSKATSTRRTAASRSTSAT